MKNLLFFAAASLLLASCSKDKLAMTNEMLFFNKIAGNSVDIPKHDILFDMMTRNSYHHDAKRGGFRKIDNGPFALVQGCTLTEGLAHDLGSVNVGGIDLEFHGRAYGGQDSVVMGLFPSKSVFSMPQQGVSFEFEAGKALEVTGMSNDGVISFTPSPEEDYVLMYIFDMTNQTSENAKLIPDNGSVSIGQVFPNFAFDLSNGHEYRIWINRGNFKSVKTTSGKVLNFFYYSEASLTSRSI